MKLKIAILSLVLASTSLFGALTEAQRVQDFQSLAGLYAKSYGPANWKILALGVNPFETAPWLKRVRAAKSDLEHAQILIEYGASLQDTHTAVTMRSNFVADLGFYCDLYDNKVMIDTVDRFLLPVRDYPFVAGDEFVSLDGKPAIEVARDLQKLIGWGNPRAILRWAIQNTTLRFQADHPFAVDLPAESTVVIRRQNGDLETYKIKWDKSGYEVRNLGYAANTNALSSGLQVGPVEDVVEVDESDRPAWHQLFYTSRQSKVASRRVRPARRLLELEDGSKAPLQAVRGFGSRTPIWTLPAGFVTRLGRGANDIFYSGTFVSEGQRIGYLRIRDFAFSTNAQLNQLAGEIVYFNNNTDGLVVDVMRNPGGFVCSSVNTVSMLVPRGFTQIGFSVRPSLAWIVDFDAALLESEFFEDPQYIIDTLRFQRDLLIGAFNDGRGMTGSIPFCGLDLPLRSQSFAYSKPMITLVDDFSTSGADHFPAMLQDNKRGKIVGTRTNGAGGSVISTVAGPWAELETGLTESLMIRLEERTYPGFPKSPFVENVGVRPDVELDYMTVDNLRNGGRPFVEAFTKIIVEEIKASKP